MPEHSKLALACKIARARIGIDVSSVGTILIAQAVAARVKVRGLSEAEYLKCLAQDDGEQEALCQLLLVSESWFEREQEPIQRALEALQGRCIQLRVLSVPCARGEEAITVLALAARCGFGPPCVTIDGYDASKQAIAQARQFLFGEYSFRGTSESFRTNLFVKQDGQFVLKAGLRNSFYFDSANLLEPTWIPRHSQYDLILCRNLLIYLRPQARRQLLDRLQSLLDPQGFIITTYSEASLLQEMGFEKSGFSTAVFTLPKAALPGPEKSTKPRHSKLRRTKSQKRSSAMCLRGHEKSPANVRTTQATADKISCASESVVEAIRKLADQGNLEEAFALGLGLLESHPSDAHSHFILGVIASSCGQLEQARTWIERALSLDPKHEDARMYLENIWNTECEQ